MRQQFLRRRRTIALAGLVLMAGLAASACAPVIDSRGYLPEIDVSGDVATGTDTKQTVLKRFGSPSTVGTFNRNAWYYISGTHRQVAFRKAVVTERQILAVYFDDADTVTDVGRFNLEDGRVVNIVSRETRTKGKELTFLQQMFGNLGRFGGGTSEPGGPGQ